MTGKGSIATSPQRKVRLLLAAGVSWLAVVLLTGVWWGVVILRQSARIVDLEQQLGFSEQLARHGILQTQRMLFWESLTFISLMIGAGFLFLWLYWRDSKRSRSLQAFFASLTHELRTPLTSIRLQAESLAELLNEGPASSSQASLISLIKRLLEDSMRLEAQVDRTLELARVEGGGPVYAQPIRLKPWLDRVLTPWSRSHHDRLIIENQAHEVLVQADPGALQVILKNLLENALRHSRKETVSVTLRTESQNGKILFRVQDDGEGFSGDSRTLGKLFAKGPSSQGAGVGLYLVQVLMKRMGGGAEFSSSRDAHRGFEARLLFPEGQADV